MFWCYFTITDDAVPPGHSFTPQKFILINSNHNSHNFTHNVFIPAISKSLQNIKRKMS